MSDTVERRLRDRLHAYADAVEPSPPDLSAATRAVDRGHRLRTAGAIALSGAVVAGAVATVVQVRRGSTVRQEAAGSPTSPVYGFTEDARVTLPYSPKEAVFFARVVDGRVWVATGDLDVGGTETLWAGAPGAALAMVQTFRGADVSLASSGDRVYVATSSTQQDMLARVSPTLQEWDASTGAKVGATDLGHVDGADGAAFPFRGSGQPLLVLTRATTSRVQQVRVASLSATGAGPSTLSTTPWLSYAGEELRTYSGNGISLTPDGDTTTVSGDTSAMRPLPQFATVTVDAAGAPHYLFAQGLSQRAIERLDLATGQQEPIVVAPHADPDGGGQSAGIDGIVDGRLLVNSDAGLSLVDPQTGQAVVSTHGYGNTESLASGRLYYETGDGAATASLDPATLQEIGSSVRPIYRGLDVETFGGTLTTGTDAAAPGPRTLTLYRPAGT